MSGFRDGDVARGAAFVDEFGMGPAERTLVAPNYGSMGLDAVAATNALADVVALAELLLARLAAQTDTHERQILDELSR